MAQRHPWAGKAHDHPDLLPLLLFIAMNGTSCAGRLFITVGTFFESFARIAQQVIATGAELSFIWAMVMGAINLCHALKSCMFAFQPAGESGHDSRA